MEAGEADEIHRLDDGGKPVVVSALSGSGSGKHSLILINIFRFSQM